MKTCESCTSIISKPYSPEGEARWEIVFGKGKKKDDDRRKLIERGRAIERLLHE